MILEFSNHYSSYFFSEIYLAVILGIINILFIKF